MVIKLGIQKSENQVFLDSKNVLKAISTKGMRTNQQKKTIKEAY